MVIAVPGGAVRCITSGKPTRASEDNKTKTARSKINLAAINLAVKAVVKAVAVRAEAVIVIAERGEEKDKDRGQANPMEEGSPKEDAIYAMILITMSWIVPTTASRLILILSQLQLRLFRHSSNSPHLHHHSNIQQTGRRNRIR